MNILIIHQGALGDFILSLPAIGAIRRSYPGSFIEIWGYPDILRLAERRFHADAVASVNREGMSHLYRERSSAPDRLMERFKRFSLVVLFGGELHNTFARNLRRHGVRDVCRISTFPGEGGTTHVIDHQLSQLANLGIRSCGDTPELFPDREDERSAQQFFDAHAIAPDAFTVAVHIGSGSRKKVWPPGYFARLSEKLVSLNNARLVVVTGPADAEAEREYKAYAQPGSSIMLHNHPLPELAAIFAKCSVFVGNDSGTTHLAAAAGVPVVALFGPTDPRVWGPRGKDVTLLRGSAGCAPCARGTMQSCAHQSCMEEISVEEVYEAITTGH